MKYLKDKKKAFQIAVFCFAGFAMAYFVFNWTMSAVIHSKKAVMVPDLRGKSVDESAAMLEQIGLSIKNEGEVFDKEFPAGTIVRQSPPAGLSVREGKVVKVNVSQGGESAFVPDVIGQPVRTAEISVRSAGFTLGEETSRFSIRIEKDRIMSQDPPGGTPAERDALVNLVISAGRPGSDTVMMPDLVGKDIAEAKSWAEENSVVISVKEEKTNEFDKGIVIRQSVEPDSELDGIKNISVTVAGTGSKAVSTEKKFYYEVPQGGSERQLRVTLLDETGEQEIFNGSKAPGTKIEVPVNPKGRARARIFVNGILVEEREVK